MHQPIRPALATCLLLCVSLFGTATEAMSLLRSENLEQLVGQSVRAVRVQVVDVRYDYDDHRLPSTFLTLRVEDPLYGDELPSPGDNFQIKLFGAPEEMQDGLRIHVDGTPDYRRGERYVLLLLQESRWGFTNTAGLMFGAFRVHLGPEGRSLASSVGGNRWAFGEGGLSGWLPGLTPDERTTVEDPLAPVPYPLLRRALTELWAGVGEAR